MDSKTKAIVKAQENALSFEQYIDLIDALHLEEKATSFQDNPEFYNYSVLSLSRMKRIVKRAALSEQIVSVVKSISAPQKWLLITESWCGDASQTAPLIARLSMENELVDLRVVLRDSNPELMEHFLTNGGMSIPILAIVNQENKELGRWGPRPTEAQQKVMDYKALPEPKPPYSEFNVVMQKWYNADKGASTIEELMALLSSI